MKTIDSHSAGKPRPARASPATVAFLYAAASAAWIVLSGALLEHLWFEPALHAKLEVGKGLAFVVVTTFALFVFLRLREREEDADAAGLRERRRAVVLLLAGSVTVALMGYAVYATEAWQEERDALGELKVVADLKARHLEQWVRERRADAIVLARSATFIEQVAGLGGPQEAKVLPLVVGRLSTVMEAYGYNAIAIVNAAGVPVLSLGLEPRMDAEHLRSASQVPDEEPARLIDLQHDAGGRTYLRIAAPVVRQGLVAGTRVGTVVLYLSPERFLYPLLKEWPMGGATGETLLVRREGDKVVYLNELMHRKDTALKLRMPLSSADLIAARAVHEGREGRGPGVDYRGQPVLAAYRPVNGTDWHLVAKRDRSEIVAPALEVAQWVAMLAVVAVSLLSLGFLGTARVQRRLDRLAAERRSDELLRPFFELPFIGMGISAPTSKRWLRANDRLCEILGYPREEFLQKTWAEMTHPDDLAVDVARFERVLRGEADGYALEKRFLRKDGAVVDTAMDVKCVRRADGGVDHLVCTVDDVTARKADRRRVQRLTRLYATLSECNLAIVECRTREALFARVCKAAITRGGMKLAWIGLLEPDGHAIVPAAADGVGDAIGYVQGIRVVVDGEDPRGLGPTGAAVRGNALVWTEDFMHDPRTAAWHERAASHRWGSSAAVPIAIDGRVVGSLTVYFADAGELDQEMRELLSEMGAGIGLALDRLALEAQREAAETALRDSEARFRQIFEHSVDAIMVGRPDGRLIAANPAACRLLGWTEAELLSGGRPMLIDDQDPRLAQALEARRRTGYFQGELAMRRKDGTQFPAEVSSSTFLAGDGDERSCIIVRDITERRRFEDQLREQLDELRRWYAATLGREERILALKHEVNELARAAGEPTRYPSAD